MIAAANPLLVAVAVTVVVIAGAFFVAGLARHWLHRLRFRLERRRYRRRMRGR